MKKNKTIYIENYDIDSKTEIVILKWVGRLYAIDLIKNTIKLLPTKCNK